MFTGRRVDILDNGSLKIQYSRNRYFDYDTGRWLSRDPMGYIDEMNLYKYTRNCPTRYVDLYGTYSMRIGCTDYYYEGGAGSKEYSRDDNTWTGVWLWSYYWSCNRNTWVLNYSGPTLDRTWFEPMPFSPNVTIGLGFAVYTETHNIHMEPRRVTNRNCGKGRKGSYVKIEFDIVWTIKRNVSITIGIGPIAPFPGIGLGVWGPDEIEYHRESNIITMNCCCGD